MKNKVRPIGLNVISNGIRIVEIAPVDIMGMKWLCVGFEEENINRQDNVHLAFVLINKNLVLPDSLFSYLKSVFLKQGPVLVRVHSECLLGDMLSSELCDCGKQLRWSFRMISERGLGVLVYLRQEGRGIGMRNKLSCLALQEGYFKGQKIENKFSSDEANLALNFPIDAREYDISARILKLLGITSVNLISGNLHKIDAIKKSGIEVKKLIDIPRDNPTKREMSEIREKLARNYIYLNIK